MGRPRAYSKPLADDICNQLANGKTLTAILSQPGYPNYSTVMGWLHTDAPECAEFSNNYARARQQQIEKWSDEIIDIADDSSEDYGFKEADDKSGKSATPFFIRENVRRSEVRISARQWIMSKRACKKWGDKVSDNTESTDKIDQLMSVLRAGPVKRNGA